MGNREVGVQRGLNSPSLDGRRGHHQPRSGRVADHYVPSSETRTWQGHTCLVSEKNESMGSVDNTNNRVGMGYGDKLP